MLSPTRLARIKTVPGECNVADEIIRQQVARNIRRGLPQAKPHIPSHETIALVCGGPSLRDTERQLVEKVWAGAKICAVNGSYDWCIDRNLKPSMMVMLDAREFNARFVTRSVAGCRYLLASQCHPRTFELCQGRDVTIWHAVSTGAQELDLLKAYYFSNIFPVTGGGTVATHALWLLRLLGFQSFHVFGLDSCVMRDEHHAYPQPENDDDKLLNVWLRIKGKSDRVCGPFLCTQWHMHQLEDIKKLIGEHGQHFRLDVHGDGLVATMLRMGAEMDIEHEEA